MPRGQTLLGEFDGKKRLRIARPGYDVRDLNLTSRELAYDSEWYETGMVSIRGMVTIAAGTAANTVIVTFPARLTRPYVVAWFTDSAGWTVAFPLKIFNDRLMIEQTPNQTIDLQYIVTWNGDGA